MNPMPTSLPNPAVQRWSGLIGLASLALVPFLAATAQSDPDKELASLRVLDGFEVRLFASEREGVRKPIQIRFDPDGRLWVVGSTSYPQIKPGEEPNDEVVVLEDTDRDGRADRSTIFASGLHIPTGLEWGDGGVYVGAATELLHLKDTDGDGRSDQRRVVLRGFGTGDTHQTINSFCWGPLGELMLSQGLHAESRVETPWGVVELRQAGVGRFWPRQVRLDPFWSGAMGAHNPFGTVFDRWGQPFVFAGNGHGIYHLTPGMIPTDHFLEQRWIWNQGRKFGGADIVENTHWPESHQGEFLTGGYLQNSVERFRLTPEGSSFKAERLPPLIESTNIAFRIVDARFGPDGALYLCDWYNPVIGHYQNSFRDPARDKAGGRIWRVTAKGRPTVDWKPLGKAADDVVARALGSGQRWDRQMARRVLADRLSSSTAEVVTRWAESLAGDPEWVDQGRLEALGVLTEQGKSAAPASVRLLRLLKTSGRPEARALAARFLGEWSRRGGPERAREFLKDLGDLVRDDHPRVRLEAVVACSYLAIPESVDVAAEVAERPMDGPLEYAFTQAVAQLRPQWTRAYEAGSLELLKVPARSAAFAKADGGSGSAQYAAGRLRRIGEVALDVDTVRQLSALVARAGGPGDLSVLLQPRSFTVGTDHDAPLQARRLREAAASSRLRGVVPDGNVAPAVTVLLDCQDPGLRAAAALVAGAWRVETLRDRLKGLVNSASASLPERVAAVEGWALMGGEGMAAPLIGWAGSGTPDAVRSAALVALVPLQIRDAARLAAEWLGGEVDPESARQIAAAFIRQKDALPSLREALETRKPSSASAEILLAELARSGRHDPALATLLSTAVGTRKRSGGWTLSDIPVLTAAVRASGNPVRGSEVFRSAQLACTSCHSVDGTPGKVGPVLAALGTAQSLESITGAIVAPQKEVKEGFMATEIVTRDGTTYQGYLRGETPDAMTLADHLSGQTVVLPKTTITVFRQLGSLMPEGLVDTLSAEDLRDLIAYLGSLGRR
jgi:putative heme-binding domain-containing protein